MIEAVVSPEISTDRLSDLLFSTEGFKIPDRRVGMIDPANAHEHFVRLDRNVAMHKLFDEFDVFIGDSTYQPAMLNTGRLIEVSRSVDDSGDTIRSIILPQSKSKGQPLNGRRGHAFSIIESSEWGIYGEHHVFEINAGKGSSELPPNVLHKTDVRIFSLLPKARRLRPGVFGTALNDLLTA